MYSLIILKYILFKVKYVILTRIPHHTLDSKKWYWDSLFSIVIVGSIKYTYGIIFCEKIMDVLFGSISYFHVCVPKSFQHKRIFLIEIVG